MNLTKSKLKKIIQEELAMLKEAWGRPEVVQGQDAQMENEGLLSFFLEWASKGAPAGNTAKDELLRRLGQTEGSARTEQEAPGAYTGWYDERRSTSPRSQHSKTRASE